MKTYFKACNTIGMAYPQQKASSLQIKNETMQGSMREVEANLEKLNPESLTFKELDKIRFNFMKKNSMRYSSIDYNKDE